jgi:hypothetical protein
MTPYVDSRDGRSLSIYGSESQIWKTFTTMFTAIDPNKDISKTRRNGAAPGVIHTGRFFVLILLKWLEKLTGVKVLYLRKAWGVK